MASAFLDASVIIAAIGKPSGGSGLILQLARKGKLNVFISDIILEEVKRNLRKKFTEKELLFFIEWFSKSKPKVIKLLSEKEIAKYKSVIDSKDAHVIAAAVKAKVDFLVTLDRKHFFTEIIKKAKLPFKILIPEELIKNYL